MNKHLTRLDMLVRQAGLSGIDELMFGGQITPDNTWHRTDCNIAGVKENSLGPFPGSMVVPAMTARCCQPDVWSLAEEISPQAMAHTVRALNAIDEAITTVELLRSDRSATPFADLHPIDAAVDFVSELDELVGNVAHLTIRVTKHLGYVVNESNKLDAHIDALYTQYFNDPTYLDELYEVGRDALGVDRDDTPITTSASAFAVVYPDDSDLNYILTALTNVFALEARSSRCVATMPRWAYDALKQLGGRAWLSKAHSELDPAVLETARVLWVNDPTSAMFDFDSCVRAALELCREPVVV